MKRFLKLGQKLANGNDKRRRDSEETNKSPLSRLSSISGSSSGWGSVSSFHAENRLVYSIDKFDLKGFTKVHKACWLGNFDKLRKHLKSDNINKVDADNRTPLHLAAAQGHKSIVIHLLNSQADFEVKDADGRTPFLVAVWNRQRDIWSILLEKGTDVNEKSSSGDSALHFAAKEGDEDVAVAVVSRGANINAININGEAPLHVATFCHQVEMVQLLLRLDANIDLANQRQMTSLMIACHKGFDDLVELFIVHNVDVTAVNSDGLTAEDIAKFNENDECFMILLKYKRQNNIVAFEAEAKFDDKDTPITKQPETKSDSDSWNDDFSEELPGDESIKSQLHAPKRLNLKFNLESLGLDTANENSLSKANTVTDIPQQSAGLNFQETNDVDISSEISFNENENTEFKKEAILNKEDETPKLDEIPSGWHNKDEMVPVLQSSAIDKDLLSELGLSEISDFSNSLQNDDSVHLPHNEDTDIEEKVEMKTKLASLNTQVSDSIKISDECPFESDDDNVIDGSIVVKEEDSKAFNESSKESKEGTLGRIGTMHEIEEIWETNALAIMDNKEEDDDEDRLYYAELAVVDSRGSTIERAKFTDDPADNDSKILNEKLHVETVETKIEWEEICQQLFGSSNEENDETSPSVSGILAEEEIKDNSVKDATFQEISLTEEVSVMSSKEDRPFTILSGLINDSNNHEKILDLIQRLRRFWIREQSRCCTLKQSNKFLNDELTRSRSKYDLTNNDSVDAKSKISEMETLIETLKHQLGKEEAKCNELELQLRRSRTQLDNIEETYLSEVNLRQKVQVALTASQEELRATEEIIDELRLKKAADEAEQQPAELISTADKTEAFEKYEQFSKLSHELRDKNGEIQTLNNDLKNKDEEIKKLNENLENKVEEIAKLQEDSVGTVNKLSRLREEIVKKNDDIRIMKEESEQKDKDLKRLDEVVLNNNEEIYKLKEAALKNGEKARSLEDYSIQMKKLCDESERGKSNLMKQVDEYKLKFEDRENLVKNTQRDLPLISELRDQLEKKQAEVKNSHQKLELADKEKCQLMSTLDSIKSECEKLKLDLAGVENIRTLAEQKSKEDQAHNCTEINLLQNKWQLLEVKYKNCKSELEDVKKLNAFYENSSNGVQTKWQTMVESLQKQQEALNREILDAKEKSVEMKGQLLSEINNLTISNRDAKMQLDLLSEEKRRTNERLSVAECNLLEKEKAKFELETNLKLLSQENLQISQQIEQFCGREKEYLAKLQTYSVSANETDSLKSRLAFETNRFNAESESNKLCNKEISRLRDEVDHLKTINKDLETRMEDLSKETNNKEHETTVLKNQIAELSKAKAELLSAKEQIRELSENIQVYEEKKSLKANNYSKTAESSSVMANGNTASSSMSDNQSPKKRDVGHNCGSLEDIRHMLNSFIKEAKENQKIVNAESRTSSRQQDESDTMWRSDMELLIARLETRHQMELNSKLQQMNQFLEEQGRATNMLEEMEFHKRNRLHREYKTALRNMETKMSKLQLHMKEKEMRQKELERQYNSLADLMKIKKRIKRKLNQQQSLQLTKIDDPNLLSHFKSANLSLLTHFGL